MSLGLAVFLHSHWNAGLLLAYSPSKYCDLTKKPIFFLHSHEITQNLLGIYSTLTLSPGWPLLCNSSIPKLNRFIAELLEPSLSIVCIRTIYTPILQING